MLTSVLAFTGTNIDDILVLAVLFSAASCRDRFRAALGYISGVMGITALAALAAGGLRLFSGDWLRLLGLIPIVMGIRALLQRDLDDHSALRATFTGTMLITLGNGADNLGVYIPLFTRSTPGEIALSALVFLVMAVCWALLASRMASLPALRRFIERRTRILVPAVLILLGLYILLL
jgi:cadmium resistance protein CadD (predicted permease)